MDRKKNKKPRRLGTLISLVLILCLSLVLGPAKTTDAKSWQDQLWSVFNSMQEEDAQSSQDQKTTESQKDNKKQEKKKQNKQTSTEKKETEKSYDPAKAESIFDVQVEEGGEYTSKWEVAAYLVEFGELPENFISKNDAKDLGWVSSEGNLDEVAPGKSIGGDRFGNYEEQLPEKKGRKYFECDIDYHGGYRDSKRIIYSNDGLVFYTEDHYETFDQLYPEE